MSDATDDKSQGQVSLEVDWLPVGNDVRGVVAALENQFFQGVVEVMVLPTDMDVATPYRPLAPTVNAVSTLEIAGLSPEQARRIATAIYTPARVTKWGDYLADDGTLNGFGYRWNKLYSFQIQLVKRSGDFNWRVMFVCLYGNNSDISSILDHSRNVTHQFALRSIGLAPDQLSIQTYVYNSNSGWVLNPKLK